MLNQSVFLIFNNHDTIVSDWIGGIKLLYLKGGIHMSYMYTMFKKENGLLKNEENRTVSKEELTDFIRGCSNCCIIYGGRAVYLWIKKMFYRRNGKTLEEWVVQPGAAAPIILDEYVDSLMKRIQDGHYVSIGLQEN